MQDGRKAPLPLYNSWPGALYPHYLTKINRQKVLGKLLGKLLDNLYQLLTKAY